MKSVAQQATGWYLDHLDPCVPHSENIQLLKKPLLVLTLQILKFSVDPSDLVVTYGDPKPKESQQEEKKLEPANNEDWRRYLDRKGPNDPLWTKELKEAYNGLGRRTRARMEAFLAGCALVVPNDSSKNLSSSSISSTGSKTDGTPAAATLSEGLAGYRPHRSSPMMSSFQFRSAANKVVRNVAGKNYAQMPEDELVVRLELYMRSLYRVKTSKEDCVLELEPARALRARVHSVVAAIVARGCVRCMSSLLIQLLECLTKELLAVDTLGEDLNKVIRGIVSEYEHGTSFASLAFLSSPDDSAQTRLTPLVLKYVKYLRSNWENLVAECEIERMLASALDSQVRHMFKTIEFRSIGHLLEVCYGLQNELSNIQLPPHMCSSGIDDVTELSRNTKAVRQALRDLQREVITVNGHVLPPATSRRELVHLLSQTLNSRMLTATPATGTPRKQRPVKQIDSFPEVDSEGSLLSSGCEGDADDSRHAPTAKHPPRHVRRRSLVLSTIDMLTRRLLVAASRTGMGGDAFFVVRDLFGGEEVEVVPSRVYPEYGRRVRPGTIEIAVRLASVTIKCNGSFDVYPRDLVGETEPLIQIHTTTTETIYLQEVREGATSGDDSIPSKPDDLEAAGHGSEAKVMLLQERKTDKTGWRSLSIRPALYEKVQVWNTPS